MRGWCMKEIQERYIGEDEPSVLQAYQKYLGTKRAFLLAYLGQLQGGVEASDEDKHAKTAAKALWREKQNEYLLSKNIPGKKFASKAVNSIQSSSDITKLIALTKNKIESVERVIKNSGGFISDTSVEWSDPPPVVFFDAKQKEEMQCVISGGLLLWKSGKSKGQPVDTTNFKNVYNKAGLALYVLIPSPDSEKLSIYIFNGYEEGSNTKIHHSSATEGKKVQCSGEISVTKGKVVSINNRSGHYLPSKTMLASMLDFFGVMREGSHRRDVLSGDFKIVNYRGKITEYRSADEFRKSWGFVDYEGDGEDEDEEIPCFELEKTKHLEVTFDVKVGGNGEVLKTTNFFEKGKSSETIHLWKDQWKHEERSYWYALYSNSTDKSGAKVVPLRALRQWLKADVRVQ